MPYERQWEQHPPHDWSDDWHEERRQRINRGGGPWRGEGHALPDRGDYSNRYGRAYSDIPPYAYYGWPASAPYHVPLNYYYGPMPDYGYGNPHPYGGHNRRDFWDRAADEVSSWFGDEGAEQRRWRDRHRGKGPKGYSRSDQRIQEDVSDRMTADGMLDPSDIEVSVSEREVTLTGTVSDRFEKRRAEDCADSVSGVEHVQNNLRVQEVRSESA